MFGGRTGEQTSKRIIASARDTGVNFINVADGYAKGESEKIVGRAIKRHRHDWVLATEVGNPMGPGAGPNEKGLGAKHIHQSIDASLKRLDTDFVDIYYFHLDDLETPMEESIQAAADIVAQGKARYWGHQQLRRLAHRRPVRPGAGHGRAAGGLPTLLQRHEPDAGNRRLAGVRVFRPRRRALQPPGPRRADR
jgi:aryl-alcohol dehydrogenase-like predicted oxidoreductase